MTHQLSNPPILNKESENLLNKNTHTVSSGIVNDPRREIKHTLRREPLELPVPNFESDNNYMTGSDIFQHRNQKLNHSDLDLDTRIGLLIKSKALAGVHPMFSELEESNSDSDEELVRKIKSTDKFRHAKNISPSKNESCTKNFDDYEKPLSRPPSPFLSKETYLFWFNKAIELKHQAKAQEKALLEKAAKMLIKEHASPAKIYKNDFSYPEDNYMIKHLLNEVCNEFKEIVKQECVNEILENTIVSSLESWWDKEKYQEINKRKMTNKCNNNVGSKENARRVRKVDLSESLPLSNSNKFDADKNKIVPMKSEPTFGDWELLNNIGNLKKENIVTSVYLENVSNPNIKKSLCSLDVRYGIDFKRNMPSNSSPFNVYQSTDHITNISSTNPIISSSHILNENPCDFIVHSSEPIEHDIEVVKNVLNLIVDDVDRIGTAEKINM